MVAATVADVAVVLVLALVGLGIIVCSSSVSHSYRNYPGLPDLMGHVYKGHLTRAIRAIDPMDP